MDGFKKPGTNILPLFSLQCDKIQCQSGTTMTAALYGRWVDWPHISVEILPSLVFNECSHVFLQGNKIIRTFQSVNVDPLHVLLVRRLKLFWHSLISFYRILYQRRPELECNEEKNRKKVKNSTFQLEMIFSVVQRFLPQKPPRPVLPAGIMGQLGNTRRSSTVWWGR